MLPTRQRRGFSPYPSLRSRPDRRSTPASHLSRSTWPGIREGLSGSRTCWLFHEGSKGRQDHRAHRAARPGRPARLSRPSGRYGRSGTRGTSGAAGSTGPPRAAGPPGTAGTARCPGTSRAGWWAGHSHGPTHFLRRARCAPGKGRHRVVFGDQHFTAECGGSIRADVQRSGDGRSRSRQRERKLSRWERCFGLWRSGCQSDTGTRQRRGVVLVSMMHRGRLSGRPRSLIGRDAASGPREPH